MEKIQDQKIQKEILKANILLNSNIKELKEKNSESFQNIKEDINKLENSLEVDIKKLEKILEVDRNAAFKQYKSLEFSIIENRKSSNGKLEIAKKDRMENFKHIKFEMDKFKSIMNVDQGLHIKTHRKLNELDQSLLRKIQELKVNQDELKWELKEEFEGELNSIKEMLNNEFRKNRKRSLFRDLGIISIIIMMVILLNSVYNFI